jgi:hypothetical protein
MGLLEGVATAAAPLRRMNTSVRAVSRQRMSQAVRLGLWRVSNTNRSRTGS